MQGSIGSSRSPQRLLRLLCALVTLLVLQVSFGSVAHAATITVTTTADERTNNGTCSLREAIRAANTDTAVDACPPGSGADKIMLPAGTYTLSIAGMEEDAALTGDLDLVSNLTLQGAGAATTIIDSDVDRVFDVRGAISVNIANVTLQSGYPGEGAAGGAIQNAGTLTLDNTIVTNNATSYALGGGIWNGGTLTLTNSVVRDNSGNNSEGGGVWNGGLLKITNSTIVGNSTRSDGGGVWNKGTLELVRSTVDGNTAEGVGGGIYNTAGLTISHTTISNNVVTTQGGSYGYGGGIANRTSGTTTVTNSTVSGNTAADAFDGSGGGVWNEGTLTLANATVANNTSVEGGGIKNSGTFYLRNSILAQNTTANAQTIPAYGPDCAGQVSSQGYNLIGNTAGCTITNDTTGNLVGVDPKLGPLGNNGGTTFTHPLLAGSPAIDTGNPATPSSGGTACASTDQRGVARPLDGNADGAARCDMGAVECVNNPNDTSTPCAGLLTPQAYVPLVTRGPAAYTQHSIPAHQSVVAIPGGFATTTTDDVLRHE